MDITKKLAFYSQNKPSRMMREEGKLSPSVKALKEHFAAEILFDHSPVIKISKSQRFSEYTNKSVLIKLISKKEFTHPIPRDKCVFFDLETTGLAGGAGTFAFLIGFAYWKDDQLVTDQYFLPDFGREYELFSQLQNWLNTFDYIVSYNGKSYDMPLLSNRFVLNRVDPDFKGKQHIDIIHMCRRVWKNSLLSCSLKSIENHLLGVTRIADIPGEFIPQAYFDFINTGVIHDVIRMIDHNLQDIISLALIFDRLHNIKENLTELPLDNNALSCLAKIAFQTNDHHFFSLKSNKDDLFSSLPDEFSYWESLFYKKNREFRRASQLWENLLKNPDYFFFSVEELAKYYEHQLQDYQSAVEIIEKVFKRFDIEEELGIRIFNLDLKKRFEKRYQRLKSRINVKSP